jgi:hypothetical protein
LDVLCGINCIDVNVLQARDGEKSTVGRFQYRGQQVRLLPENAENPANAHPIFFTSASPPLAGSRIADNRCHGRLRIRSTGRTRGTGAIKGPRPR